MRTIDESIKIMVDFCKRNNPKGEYYNKVLTEPYIKCTYNHSRSRRYKVRCRFYRNGFGFTRYSNDIVEAYDLVASQMLKYEPVMLANSALSKAREEYRNS